MGEGIGQTGVSGAEFKQQMAVISRARSKQKVFVGRMKGRLVVKELPRLAILTRLILWLKSESGDDEFRASVVRALADGKTDKALKQQILDSIASGTMPCFSKKEAEQVRKKEGMLHRYASISGINPPGQLMARSATPKVQQGGTFFIHSNTDREAVIDHYRRNGHPGDTAYIGKPSDFDKDDLVRTVTWSGGAGIDSAPGRLFKDDPVTLILDFSQMTPAQIASLNELFDQPARYQGRLLGKNVSLVCLVKEEMLAGGKENPGPDTWRRLDKLGTRPIPEPALTPLSDEVLLKSLSMGEQDEDDEWATALETKAGNLSLDFYKEAGGWQTQLFGGFQLSDKGQLHFKEGILHRLDRKGAILELTNAPQDNPDFVRALATAVREGGFWANGQWVTLPGDLQIHFSETGREEINARLSNLEVAESDQSFACINDENFDNVMADLTLTGDKLQENNTLAELVKGGSALMVSCRLQESQWVQLLNKLESLTPRPRLMVDPKVRQPDSLELKRFMSLPKVSENVALAAQDAEIEIGEEEKVFEYEVTARTAPQTLLSSVEMTSQGNMTFKDHQTPLLEALLNGEHVVLKGLETNPAIARQLESLLSARPYVFLSGRKIPVPGMKLTCKVPDNRKLEGLWRALPKPESSATVSISDGWLKKLGMEQQVSVENLQKLNELLVSLGQLPRSPGRHYPNIVQKLNETLLRKVAGQLQREMNSDGCKAPNAYHWQKALNDVIAKEYRGDANVYGFVKSRIADCFPDAVLPDRVDTAAVQQWLQQQPVVNREVLKQNFWEVARYFSPGCVTKPTHYTGVSDKVLDAFLPMLVNCQPDDQKEALAARLGVDLKAEAKPFHSFNGETYNRAYNALVVAESGGRVQTEKSLHEQALELSEAIEKLPPPRDQKSVAVLLEQYFSPELLRQDFKDLAEAFCSGKGSSKIRQRRRVVKLCEKLRSTPLLMIKGEAGTGKSYTAHAAAELFGEGLEPLVLSLSPEHTQEELFGRQVLVQREVSLTRDQLSSFEHSDSAWVALCQVTDTPIASTEVAVTFDKNTLKALRTKLPEQEVYALAETFEDRKTEFQSGPLLEWARMENPPVLILDEANLVKEGVLQPLAGLKQQPPVLFIFGEQIKLSDKHRVIMTGNPESYDGRRVDSRLRAEMLTLNYRPIAPEVLAESVFKPGLPENWPNELKQSATKAAMSLYRTYQKVLPEHTFGPRDLKDILARISFYSSGQGIPTEAMMHEVLWQSVADSLGGEVTAETSREFRALKHWYSAHLACDSTLIQKKQEAFDNFYDALKQSKAGGSFDFDVPSVKQLAYQVWLDLEKSGGKHAFVIEGEAGRGKDALLNELLPFWLTSKGRGVSSGPGFDRINASPENWDEIKELARQAMEEGRVLVISELNTLPSRYLEGLFNEVLNGEAKEGFKLIATINPATYSGREAMSSAMQSRCTQAKIGQFTESELRSLMRRGMKGQSEFTDWLVAKHCRLHQDLEAAGSSVKLPLVKLLDSARSLKNCALHEREREFKKEYGLALTALAFQKRVAKGPVQTPDLDRQERERKVCRAINTLSEAPVSVVLIDTDQEAAYSVENGVLKLPDSGDPGELIKLGTQMLKPSEELDEQVKALQAKLAEHDRSEAEEKEARELAEKKAEQPEEPEVKEVSKGGMFGSMYKYFPIGKLATIFLALPAGKALQLLMYLPIGKLASLLSYIPLEKTVSLIAKLPLNRLLDLVQYLPVEKVIGMLSSLPLEKLVSLAEKLPLDKIAGFIEHLPLEKLAGFLEKLPLEKMAGAFENMDAERFQKLAKLLPEEKLKGLVEGFGESDFSRLAEHIPEDKVNGLLEKMGNSQKAEQLKQTFEGKLNDQPVVKEEPAKETVASARPSEISEEKKESAPGVSLTDEELRSMYISELYPYFIALKGAELRRVADKLKLTMVRSLLRKPMPDEARQALLDTHKEYILSEHEPGAREEPYSFKLEIKDTLPTVEDIQEVKAEAFKEERPESSLYKQFVQGLGEETEVTDVLIWFIERGVSFDLRRSTYPTQISHFMELLKKGLANRTEAPAHEAELLRFITLYQQHASGGTRRVNTGRVASGYDLTCLRLLNGFKALHEEGLLSETTYQAILYKSVTQEMGLYPGLVAHLLPDLLSHPIYGPPVSRMLAFTYEQVLTVEREVPEVLASEVEKMKRGNAEFHKTADSFKLPLLENMLGKRSIESDWSASDTGKPIDIGRLTRKADPYPDKGAGEELPRMVLSLDRNEVEEFLKKELEKRPELSRLDSDTRVLNVLGQMFTQSLMQYRDKVSWKVVVPQKMTWDSNKDHWLNPGQYGFEVVEPLMSGLLRTTDMPDAGVVDDCRYRLDSGKLMEALDEPNGTCLDSDAIQQCVSDMLDQLTADRLYEHLYDHVINTEIKGSH